MDYLQNHIWCSDSNWGGEYNCRHVVTMHSYSDGKDDWNAITNNMETFVDEEGIVEFLKYIDGSSSQHKAAIRKSFTKNVPNLDVDVLEWLNQNVADRPKVVDESNKGWCVGSAHYRSMNTATLSIFFYRRKDAMAFIKTWSKWKKPIHYCQYFTDVRKQLNLSTGKYEME